MRNSGIEMNLQTKLVKEKITTNSLPLTDGSIGSRAKCHSGKTDVITVRQM